jgi:hypothetical protein
MSNITKIHNYLDHLTVEEVLKYAAQGFEFIIADGHVQAMVMKKEDSQDGR